MIEYTETKKGYFYKKYQNGDTKRISLNEYNKNVTKQKKKLYNMKGGYPRKLDIYFGIVTYQTIGDCIKELIEASYDIYFSILSKGIQTTIVCGGQSPSYYCLAMMNFTIFNPELANIVILPHSKGGQKSNNQIKENMLYCERLKEKGIKLRNNVIIIDGVHSGTGILALESALKYCFPKIITTKIAINAYKGISKIPVNKEIILPCEPKFSDVFPRLVKSYHPRYFNNSSKFITEFINLETNPIAEMIIDISKNYPMISVEDTEWYKLNNYITENIAKEKIKKIKNNINNLEREKILKEEEAREEKQKTLSGFFTPIILNNPKRYQCPICKTITGIGAPENPTNISLFSHNFNCPNKYKIPIELLINQSK